MRIVLLLLFSQMGIWAKFEYDSRKGRIPVPGRIRFDLEGRYFPELLGVESAFGAISGKVSVSLSAISVPLQPTLAIRLGESMYSEITRFMKLLSSEGDVSQVLVHPSAVSALSVLPETAVFLGMQSCVFALAVSTS